MGFRHTCRLKIRRNSIVENPTGLVRYQGKGSVGGKGAVVSGNHYWKNRESATDFAKEASALTGDPQFAAPDQGDYSVANESPLTPAAGTSRSRVGLTDAKAIQAPVAEVADPPRADARKSLIGAGPLGPVDVSRAFGRWRTDGRYCILACGV